MRLVYGLALFVSFVLAIVVGGTVFALALGTAACIAGNEFIVIAQAKGINVSRLIIRLMIPAFFVLATLPQLPATPFDPTFSIDHLPLLLTVGVLASLCMPIFAGKSSATISDIAATI